MKVLAVLVCILLNVAQTAAASEVSIGQTVLLTRGDARYSGVLVKSDEIAPCSATSSADDIRIRRGDQVTPWPKPCPYLDLTISRAAVRLYLSRPMTLEHAVAAAASIQ